MRAQWHPDATALAEYRAGLAGDRRGRRLAAHVARCGRCASVSDQLAAVSAVLASAPAPPLPEALEQRILTALSAEARATEASRATEARATEARATEASRATQEAQGAHATPAAQAPQDTEAAPAGPGAPVPEAAGGLSHRPVGSVGSVGSGGPAGPVGPVRRGSPSHPARWKRPRVLVTAAAACLVIFGCVYAFGLAHLTAPKSPAPAAARSSSSAPLAGAPAPAAAPRSRLGPAAGSRQAGFVVTVSGTRYQQATLAAQVRAELARSAAVKPSAPGGASASVGALPGQAGVAPSATLAACVLHLTGQVRPRLVDRATYQGKAAYVIAVTNRAWVVEPGCTAGNPELIASTGL